MKYLKSIDFIGQSIILLVLVGGSSPFLFSGEGLGLVFYIGLMCQFVLGCWQMASSILLTLLRAEHFKLRKTHLTLALLNLLLAGVSFWLVTEFHSDFTYALLIVFGVAASWALGIFYYSITWRWMFPKRHSGKFLSHISF